MEVECRVPPGFRFHPTEEELVGYYLTRKVASEKIELGVINDIDLYRIEPWDLQEKCKLGYEQQSEWYFFSHKDKKYPSGTRTNRATNAGFWKATGRDKEVLSKSRVIGLRKTLVFYEGRAPNGRKSDWIMHEYRLQSGQHGPPQEEGWVVCRAFKKPVPNPRPSYYNTYSPYNVREQNQYEQLNDLIARPIQNLIESNQASEIFDQPLGSMIINKQHASKITSCGIFECIPHLDSPSIPTTNIATSDQCSKRDESKGQFVDWKALDNLLASQLNDSTSCSNSKFPMVGLLDQYDMNDPSQEDEFLASFDS